VQCVEDGRSKPETFDFLGFTHICAKSRNGRFVLKRLTSRKRMRTRLKHISAELRRIRHRSIPEQGAWLGAVMRGYFAYHAVPTNGARLNAFRTEVTRSWQRALRRRSQRDRMNWGRMRELQRRWLPSVRILHPWPDERFDVRTRGRSRVR
jgi:RNA-directed DNA polymerase